MTPWNCDPMAIRTNSDSFVLLKITTKYNAVFEMCGSRVPTLAAHRNHTNALLVYLWYTNEFQEAYLVERSAEQQKQQQQQQ